MPNALNFKDFEERLANSASVGPTEVQFIAADAGGIDLAYEVFTPPGNFSDLLVFYHGGGSNMHAGYDRLASELASRAPLAVCLPDMRGHGASGGRRGHADTPTDVWKDVDCLVARLARDFRVRIHLGGHSSAAGMLVNYCILHTPQTNVSSLILLAPEFGFRAGLYRAGTCVRAHKDLAFSSQLLLRRTSRRQHSCGYVKLRGLTAWARDGYRSELYGEHGNGRDTQGPYRAVGSTGASNVAHPVAARKSDAPCAAASCEPGCRLQEWRRSMPDKVQASWMSAVHADGIRAELKNSASS
jgi:alpha-beta hydrolase superfamily lysophospholipase